ncbi:MAG: glucosaminidase domain-containing protein [Paludibacter sp.]
MKNKRINFYIFFIVTSTTLFSQNKSQAYLNYIENYWQLAVIQQNEYGIPASITLAQGLLESGAGQSEFVRNSNNHFGIKCHDWTGDKVYHDDDAQGECFRKYNNVIDSYRDHSLFLKNKGRYSFLFDYSPTDYESWAHGLKKAGYATDPTYAYKLISIIDNYELHKFDLGKKNAYSKSENHKPNKSVNSVNLPSIGKISAEGNHIIYKCNHIRFIITENGDTYGSIADEFGISESKLKEYNEIDTNYLPIAGTQLYIQRKRTKAARGNKIHVIKQGETMYSISQTYAIRLEKLYNLNKMPFTEGARIGKALKLR